MQATLSGAPVPACMGDRARITPCPRASWRDRRAFVPLSPRAWRRHLDRVLSRSGPPVPARMEETPLPVGLAPIAPPWRRDDAGACLTCEVLRLFRPRCLFVVPRAGPADSLFPLARRCRVLDVQRTTAKAPARRLPSTEPLHPLPCCRSDSMFRAISSIPFVTFMLAACAGSASARVQGRST